MTPQRQLVIIEHRTHDILQHLGRALTNTIQSMHDGYPTRSPGSGNPGGGSLTALSRPPAGININAPITQLVTDPARQAHDQTLTLVTENAHHASNAIEAITGHPPIPPASRPIPQAAHAHRIARLLAVTVDTHPKLASQLPDLDTWLHTTDQLHPLITRWAWTTHTPTPTDELLATDLTEHWCRRHLTAGQRIPRYRGDLCQWCYRHHAEHGELPTSTMLEAHQAGNWRRLAALINARHIEHTATTKPKKRRR